MAWFVIVTVPSWKDKVILLVKLHVYRGVIMFQPSHSKVILSVIKRPVKCGKVKRLTAKYSNCTHDRLDLRYTGASTYVEMARE